MTTPIPVPARGRGRGRGNTLPAWMTHQQSGNDEGGNRRGESMSTSISATTTTMTSEHRQNREEDRRQRRPDDKDDRISSSSAYDRGYGREQRDWDTREHINSDRNYRDQTYQYRDRDRMPPDSRRNASADHRGHHGLGYDERGGRGGGEREISWERDRAEGSGRVGWGRGGRNENEMNFVRGRSEVMYGGDRYDKDSDEDRGRGDAVSSGMGRGRGRGRGTNINAPAWMTAGSGSAGGPVGQTSNIDPNGTTPMGKDNESMEMLLAQARQVQQKLENSSRHDGKHVNLNNSKSATNTSDVVINGGNNSNEQREAAEKLLQQRQLEEANEAARKAAEDEFRRLEQLREEDERRQLLALVGNHSDDENQMDSIDDISSDNNKHRHGSGEEDDDDNNTLFEFETEEEREERLARKRREERRKKLKTMREEQAVDANAAAATIVVDQPRNVAGVIHSELHNGKGGTDNDTVMHADTTSNNVHMHSSQVIQTTEQNDGSSSNDSFDMFATDNATPVPIHSSTDNTMITSTKTMRNRYTSANSNAQECDDAEGYYKASIGEIITLPKESVDDVYQSARDESDRISRFRVLGIVGKGVFSSVIKCVEESSSAPPDPNAGTSGETNNTAGRVIAMKIIRNNEVMAKAAAKEMRILRMLCHQPTKSKSKNKPTRTENSGANGETNNSSNPEEIDDDDDDDGEERERENHHIVRLLDVDPTIASAKSKDNLYATSVYAAPPPEFRSHCVFLFEFLPYNLREVLSKFGKNVGINLTAVRSYARQLLCALAHLERHRVVHADLKPDNILVSANFSTVKLADFGSAFFETDHDNDPTPYLVSRFYRPPEVILGLEYNRMVDLWSTAVTIGELFTGTVLFPGDTNNDMLVRFMDAMGPLSHKMAKRHALSYTRMGLQPHFEVGITGGTYQLRKQDVDRVTGQPICRLVNVLSAKTDARLSNVLLRASKGGGALERVNVLTFADFLNRCLALDPARRLSVRDALRHEFFKKKKKKKEEA